MEKQLVETNKAIEYLVKLERSYSDKTFGIRNKNGKIILKGIALQRAKEKQLRAKNTALATWANWNGSNRYLQVLHDKDIGKISHGGKGGFSGKGGGNMLGSVMDWTINQQKFNTNSDNTRYTSGHVKGMLTSSAALEELRKDQAWILRNLGSSTITKDMYNNMPWVIRHSDIPELEDLYGSKYSLGVANPLQIPHKGRIMGDDGMPNPFASDQFIDYRYDKSPRTVTRKRSFLGINFGSTSKTVPGDTNYNIKDYKFKTDHFGSSNISGDSEQGSNVTNQVRTNQSSGLGIESNYDTSKGIPPTWHDRSSGYGPSEADAATKKWLLSIGARDRDLKYINRNAMSRLRISGPTTGGKGHDFIQFGDNPRNKTRLKLYDD